MSLQNIRFLRSIYGAKWRLSQNSRRVFDAHRGRLLNSLLSHSIERVPFQRERLAKIDLSQIDLEQIPPTDKSEMMACFNETVADHVVTLAEVQATESEHGKIKLPVVRGKYVVVKTSGTSGKPSWLVCGMNDWAMLLGASYSRMSQLWLTPSRMALSVIRPLRVATVAAEHALSMTWQGAYCAGKWSGLFNRSRFLNVIDATDRIVDELTKFQPEHLHVYPTAVESIARYVLDRNHKGLKPVLITVGSEALTPIALETIREAFPQSALVDNYGTSECLPISTDCRFGRKHINTDYVIVEPRDSTGHPVKDGVLSDHVLVTNLVNRVQPIIRFRIDDSIRVSHEPCECGSVLPIVEIVSRKGSLIHLRNDRGDWQTLSPPVIVDTMLHTHGVAQYQVVHTRQNELVVRFQPSEGSNPAEAADSILQQYRRVLTKLNCADSVRVHVETVSNFERTGVGGKLHQIISQVEPPARTTSISPPLSRPPMQLTR